MTRLHVIVEGETEEGFVEQLLRPHLRRHSVDANPILVPNTPGARRREKRGGVTSFAAPRWIIRQKLKEDPSAYTTTMFDYYGLPDDFPGVGDDNCPPRLPDRVDCIEERLAQTFNAPNRFIPYLQVHEFEALLFSDVETLDQTINALPGTSHSRLHRLQQVVAHVDTPEDIDDDPETAPSTRLQDYYPGYQKVPFGELIVESIGLDTIRSECPRFNAWVTQLEQLTPFEE